jgi:hypothetical protein
LVTDETSGLNKKVSEQEQRIADLETAMIWGSLTE